MLCHKHPQLFSLSNAAKPFSLVIKALDADCIIKLVTDASEIPHDATKDLLVRSFIGAYNKDNRSPSVIDDKLDSWFDGENSVRQYYINDFYDSLRQLVTGEVKYWVQATINGKLVGMATFKLEDKNPNAVYMDLLAVLPEYQRHSIGKRLVFALRDMRVMPALNEVNLLLRIINDEGRKFYERLGFHENVNYKRGNFVKTDLLVGFSWRSPLLQEKPRETYCGFKRGFLLSGNE